MKQATTLSRDSVRDRIRGCIFGNAIGDAYGLATEFMSKKRAAEKYGNGPIQFGLETSGYPVWEDGHRDRWDRNDFTDDTDQLIIILQTLQQTQDGSLSPVLFAQRLEEWSKIGLPELGTPPRGIGYTVGSVLSHPEFASNPHLAAYEVWDKRGRTLAPNGAVMRTSVLGIESFWDEDKVIINTMAAAKVTHADPRSVIAAIISSVLISRLLRGGGTDQTSDHVRIWNPKLEDADYRQNLLQYLGQGSDQNKIVYEGPTIKDQFAPKDITKSAHQEIAGSKGIIQSITDFFSSRFGGEQKPEPNQNRPNVELRDNIGWAGVDEVGKDDAMMALSHSVIDDYAFLLLKTDLVPAPSAQATFVKVNQRYNPQDHGSRLQPTEAAEETRKADGSTQNQWLNDLNDFCFPEKLEQLDLECSHTMGYAYKCIGSGVFAVTRRTDPKPTQIPEYEGSQGLFRGVMEQVTLEAGDADTNCAVIGSLLGARFGLEKGIPEAWWKGLKHFHWLDINVEAFVDRIIADMERFEQS
ncbi:ADP-ribosylglycohydrolase [Basidiobolus meristosporus CBS 931.73]|uniref:ADP-ribosylglycohydrolase n=1 Tax=Basidiobolus meristosporus CBS 931.73 TaxID=1314790 RepID=A0A1Y1Y0R0_9FUNG|nr:ADP-ribosylglycohydrolase [Basidiobolus meristosporus CBS 931.73]|eukprot:ORX91306.1 ADP-ribosylglycohydrolase [Basidiobolus meristosporus CBS 931.73]